jgi:hypothetical protein
MSRTSTGAVLLVGDLVNYTRDTRDPAGSKPERWRVISHHYRVDWDDHVAETLKQIEQRVGVDRLAWEINWELVCEELLKEHYRRLEKGLPAANCYRYIRCHPDEATHVGLSSAGGAIAPITQCEYVETVPWSRSLLLAAQLNASSPHLLNDPLYRRTEWCWE